MKCLFVTGTRADFGKMKGLISALSSDESRYSIQIVATGMHLLTEFGSTLVEIENTFPNKVVQIKGQKFQENMSNGFARFITGFNLHLESEKPDVVLVHGDRFDALGAAIAASNMGIHVVHIEGGEVSGTIDEAIRHSVSKFAHIHFVSNEKSKERVCQLGEDPDYIFVTGSPETDVLLGEDLPSLTEVKDRYDIDFEDYAVFCFHPVVSERDDLERQIGELIKFSNSIDENIIWIYPNNDLGGNIIIDHVVSNHKKNLKIFESMRFESYLTLLKNAKVIIGNSSSGVREAPVLDTPCVNIGSRQAGRVQHPLVFDCEVTEQFIMEAYQAAITSEKLHLRKGTFKSIGVAGEIKAILDNLDLKKIPIQKTFHGN